MSIEHTQLQGLSSQSRVFVLWFSLCFPYEEVSRGPEHWWEVSEEIRFGGILSQKKHPGHPGDFRRIFMWRTKPLRACPWCPPSWGQLGPLGFSGHPPGALPKRL